MQMLGNLGAKRNLHFIFSAPLCSKNISAPLVETVVDGLLQIGPRNRNDETARQIPLLQLLLFIENNHFKKRCCFMN